MLSALLALTVGTEGGEKSKTAAPKLGGDRAPVVYDDVTEGSKKLDRDAKTIYAGKFRIIEVAQKEGFVPPQLKGTSFDYPGAYKDPRGTRERETRFKVVCLFIIDATGLVIEPRIVQSTDPRMSAAIINSIAYRRWVPARFRGVPVACLYATEVEEAGQREKDDTLFKNGLGLQGSRDR